MFQLRDLLGHAVKRARVSTQVSASQIVSIADAILNDIMGEKKRDARATSYRDGILTIETLHSGASQFILSQELALRTALQEDHPEHSIREVRYRVVHHFRKSEL